jgi:hypothetical protein
LRAPAPEFSFVSYLRASSSLLLHPFSVANHFLLVQLQEPTDPALLAEQIKMFQVPYKILCKVVNVELKVRDRGSLRRRRVFSSPRFPSGIGVSSSS